MTYNQKEKRIPPDTIPHWLKVQATAQGTKTAITFLRDGRPETEITYAGLQRDVNRFANTLLSLGVQKGDRVISFLPKSLIAIVAHFAIQTIGAMAVPLNPGFKKNEMAYLLNDADPSVVIVDPEKRDLILEIKTDARLLEVSAALPYQKITVFGSAPETAPDIEVTPMDPGLIIYSSGTTGNPKGAVLTQGNLVSDARTIIDIWQIKAADVLCHSLPLFHIHGLCFALHTALLSGAQVRMVEPFKAETVLTELSRGSGDAVCTLFMAVPAMYTKLMDFIGDHHHDFSHMRLLASGSAPLLVSEFNRIVNIFGREPVEREGMSETGMNFSNPLNGRCLPGSIGLPLPNVQVRLVDPETLTDVPQGEIGEIWLKSPSITPGYWRKPKETADTFTEGWFRTGDLGKKDSCGYYFLTDRIKHIIISGGENVSAKEVETVINRMEGVQESAVVGLPDREWGEKVVAAVQLKPGFNLAPKNIMAFCREHLHNWKCPKEIIFLGEIPRNTMGKILKEEVKKMFRP